MNLKTKFIPSRKKRKKDKTTGKRPLKTSKWDSWPNLYPPGKKTRRPKNDHSKGSFGGLEMSIFRHFDFLSIFLGGINLVRWFIWRSWDVVFSSFWLFVFFPGGINLVRWLIWGSWVVVFLSFCLFVFFPGGYNFGQMAHLGVLRCRFFVFLAFCLFSRGV